MVATVRALKMHGGLDKNRALIQKILHALEKGIPNLLRHVSNIKSVYKLPCVVAINRFPTDTDGEIDFIINEVQGARRKYRAFHRLGGRRKGRRGAWHARLLDSARRKRAISPSAMRLTAAIEEKIEAVVKKVYGGNGINILPAGAESRLQRLNELGFAGFPVCIAKTQYSFSDDPALLGAPDGFHGDR